jgi:hypothetical protein
MSHESPSWCRIASGCRNAECIDRNERVEFPTKSVQGVKGYRDCSYSAGDKYPKEE